MNKDLFIIIIGKILQIIILFASMRLLTTLLSVEEVGNYYIILSIIAFFNLVFLNPPGMYFTRHLLHWQKSKNLFNALFIYIIFMMIVAFLSVPSIVFLFEYTDYVEKFSFSSFVVLIIFVIIVSTTHRNIIYSLNILGYRKEFVIFLLSTLTLGLMISISLLIFYQATSLFWFYGIVISEMLTLYFIFQFFIQDNKLEQEKIKSIFNRHKIQEIFIFMIPIGVTNFLMWGQNISYRFIVDYKYSSETLSYIAIGLSISVAVFSSIEAIIMQYFNPLFFKDILEANKKERTEAWINLANTILPMYILTLIFTIFMSESIVTLLLDSKFHNSYIYTILGAVIEFFRVIINLLNKVSLSEYKTTYTIKPYLIGFLIVIIFLVFFDFSTNLLMIPFILVLAYFVVCIIMYFQMKKILEIRIKLKYFQLLSLSLPFCFSFFLDNKDSIFYSFIYLILFGSYFLLSIWLVLRDRKDIIK